MWPARRALVFLMTAASLLSAACAEPPNKEMQQAEGAIAAARAAGAEEYSRDEFQGALDALQRARGAVNDGDYRLALNNALGSRERAENAAKLGSDAKAIARGDAERTLATLAAKLAEAETHLKALESVRASRKTAATLRRPVADAVTGLQKARAAFDQGDYAGAATAAANVTERLAAATSELETPPAGAGRRKG